MPGKEIRVGDQDLALGRADRGEVGVLDVAAMPQVVADHELRRLRAGALRAPRRLGNSGTSLLWNWTSSLIAQTRCIVRTIDDQQRAFDAHREVDARRLLAAACSCRR